VEATGQASGRIGGQNSWVIDELKTDDVVVVDMFGKIRDGVFSGDNLATAVKANSDRGMVLDGGLRDVQGVIPIPEFNVYARDWHPSAYADVTMIEINGIVRIGSATCLPGDVVLGTMTGVIFIPPHLAEEIVEHAEDTRYRDEFGKQRITEGTYTPGQIDREFSENMDADFQHWRAERRS